LYRAVSNSYSTHRYFKPPFFRSSRFSANVSDIVQFFQGYHVAPPDVCYARTAAAAAAAAASAAAAAAAAAETMLKRIS
jgi:hypothetical protein